MSHKDWARPAAQQTYTKPSYPPQFDTIIVGAGPAGMTATVYAARRKMTVLLICGHEIGGQMRWSSDIENYSSIKKITGPELTDRFYHHIKSLELDSAHFDVWIREKEVVTKIEKQGESFHVSTSSGETFLSKTLILTAGKVPRTLNIPGEEIARQGNGLSFCATCDAPLYKDKKMAIVGGGNSAMDVALQLEKYTNDITIFTDLDHLIGENVLMEKLAKSPAIHVKYQTKTLEVLLDDHQQVRGLLYTENGGSPQEFSCTGIFEEIGNIPATTFLDGFLTLNEKGEIPVNRQMRTEKAGVFAAGDVTDEIHKQVIVASGQGAIAALEAHEFILNSR
jgi:alkyl hydroperoxide reductase subunit F